MSLGILTNDLHQLAFRFPDGVANYDRNYIHGPLYYLSLVWVVGLFLVILVIALTRCAISANKKNVWMPLVPLGFGLLYCILFLLNPDNLIQQLFKSAEMICFVFPAFMEGLILARLLPSNDSYAALWYACNLSCGLMDHNGVLHSVPEQQTQLSPAEIRTAHPAEQRHPSLAQPSCQRRLWVLAQRHFRDQPYQCPVGRAGRCIRGGKHHAGR